QDIYFSLSDPTTFFYIDADGRHEVTADDLSGDKPITPYVDNDASDGVLNADGSNTEAGLSTLSKDDLNLKDAQNDAKGLASDLQQAKAPELYGFWTGEYWDHYGFLDGMKMLTGNPFSGFAGISSLIWHGDDADLLQSWEEGAYKFFCEILHSNIDCWLDDLCEDRTGFDDMDNEGTVYTTTSSGDIQLAAHIEGERTQPYSFQNSSGTYTFYQYKVSYIFIDTEDDEDTTIGIYLSKEGESGYGKTIGTLTVSDGDTASAMGGSMVIFTSPNKYTGMKMTFSPKIRVRELSQSSEKSQVTNKFTEVGQAAESIEGEGGTGGGGSGGGGGGGTGGGLSWE
ncbi:hypothetical protein JW707_01035, partial [Candidatus Woesearchaeota archaeon]|nr:hypothetical protein [Candidatus Woesearchaeota archaeon]